MRMSFEEVASLKHHLDTKCGQIIQLSEEVGGYQAILKLSIAEHIPPQMVHTLKTPVDLEPSSTLSAAVKVFSGDVHIFLHEEQATMIKVSSECLSAIGFVLMRMSVYKPNKLLLFYLHT